jgi:hypothetical protein
MTSSARAEKKARIFKKMHLVLTCSWGLLAIPTVVWWSESILWVALISVYANMAGHWSAYQASRAEENQDSS